MVGFNETCPACKGPMADGNKYCKLECYYQDNPEKRPLKEETVL